MDYRIKSRPKIPRNKYGYLSNASTGNYSGGGGGNVTIGSTTDSGEADHALEADHSLTADKLTKSVMLWGNAFDGSQSVTGDITVDNIIVDEIHPMYDSDIVIGGGIDVDGSITATLDLSVGGDIESTGSIKTESTLTVDGQTTLNATTNTKDVLPQGNNLYDLGSSDMRYNKLYTKDIDNSDTITTKNLTVTGSAHFFELIIDRIKSVGGSAIFTPADGFVIDKVEAINNRYRLYWKNSDDDGNARKNMWKRGDFALCMTFNKATVGTSHNVSNKYYWAYVPWTSEDEATQPTDGYNFIDIAVNESGLPIADGTVNPEVGDNIVMCGHKKFGTETDAEAAERGSAIYVSAYNGLDSGLKAPFIAQYRGIKTFELQPYRHSYFDAVGARFVGDFTISPSQMEEIISQVSDGTLPYISDGSDGFTANHWIVWDAGQKQYKDSGIIAKGTDGTSITISSTSVTYQIGNSGTTAPTGTWTTNMPTLVQGKYLWTRAIVNYSDGHSTTSYSVSYISKDGVTPVKGVDYDDGHDGKDSTIYKLYPIIEQAIVKANENLDITLDYLVYKQVGNNTPIDFTDNIMNMPYPNWWYVTFKDNVNTSETPVPFAKYNNTYKVKYFTDKHTDIQSITIKLWHGNQLYDSRTIAVTYEPAATFEVDQKLGSITARVQATENDIEGLNTKYTEVKQTADGVKVRVDNVENDLESITDRVTEVETTADGVKTTVSRLNIEGTRNNLLWESNLTGRWNNIRYVGDPYPYADMTERKYSSVILNAFRGMNAFRAMIPVLPYSSTLANKKYNGLRWGCNGYRAIKTELNKTYTLSVWAKANEANTKCFMEANQVESIYGDRVSGGGQVHEMILTSEWKQYQWSFKPKGEYTEIFIYTTNSRTATSNATTVQDMMLCMPLLTDNGETQYSLNADDKDVVQANILDNTNTFVVGGNLESTSYQSMGNYEFGNTKYVYTAQNASAYVDLIKYNIVGDKIKPNRDYVLSFVARTETTDGKLNCYMYNSAAAYGQTQSIYCESSTDDVGVGSAIVNLTPYWTKYYVHYHTLNDLKPNVKIAIRQYSGDKVWIAQPKLEFGAVATEYTTSATDFETPSNVSSKIEQKADEITLSVTSDLKTTGIDITNGQIMLNADNTIVNNNLTVGSLQTSGNNATITINDGVMKVYGSSSSQPNIIFGVDENGYAVLSYYDKDGTLLYNLGPEGIFNTFGTVENKFMTADKYLKCGIPTLMSNTMNSITANSGTNYYQFMEGYQWIAAQKVKRYNISGTSLPSTTNGTYYASTAMNTSKLPTGTVMPNGQYIGGVQPAIDTTDATKRMVGGVYVLNGKIANTFFIYYKYDGKNWKLTDHKYNVVNNKTYSAYLELTGQAPRT